jgi:hypothetical protein
VREACAAVAAESGEVVEPANFNDPKQTVIAGSKAGVDRACEKLKASAPSAPAAGGVGSIPLFADEAGRRGLARTPGRRGDPGAAHPGHQQHRRGRAEPPEAIRDALYRQAFGPVRWVEVTQALRARGLSHIFECGPGKVLSGLVKRVDAEIVSMTVLDPASLALAKEHAGMSEASAAPQVALVTGASRGIGRAIALALAAAGLRVVGTATTAAGAAGITDALASSGGQGLVLDVTDGAALDAAVDAIVKQHGGLHVLVNNAGITRDTCPCA